MSVYFTNSKPASGSVEVRVARDGHVSQLPTTYYQPLLPSTHYLYQPLLPTTYYLLSTLTIHYLLMTTYYLLLTTYYALLTTYYLLRTTYLCARYHKSRLQGRPSTPPPLLTTYHLPVRDITCMTAPGPSIHASTTTYYLLLTCARYHVYDRPRAVHPRLFQCFSHPTGEVVRSE